jgi:hypothetical protein
MARTVQPDEPIGNLEIRVGAKYGPPHEGGRRGSLAYDGDFPLAAKPWLQGLHAHPLAERFGFLWIYLDGQLVGAQPEGAPAPDDPNEVRARQAVIDLDALEGDASRGKLAQDRLEVRLASLAERVVVEQRRVDLLRTEGLELEARIKAERQRVEHEVAQLDQGLAQARQVSLAVKTQLQQEQLDFAGNMTKLQEQVDDAFRRQLKRTTDDAEQLAKYESVIAEASVGRKTNAVAQTTAVVNLMERIEEGALNKLMPQGPRPPGAGEKCLVWLTEGGGAAQVGDVVSKIIGAVSNRPPKPPGT